MPTVSDAALFPDSHSHSHRRHLNGAFAQWRQSRSAGAFREVVAAHLPWVLATARRRLGEDGGESGAEDVAQQVFLDLVRLSGRVRPENLGGWLHRHTLFHAAKALRAQRRRTVRERIGGELMNGPVADGPAGDSLWREVAPQLDASLDELSAADREALLLRFFQSLPLAAVGGTLGISAPAAQKRVERALNRLRALLRRRGVTGTSTGLGLGALLSIHAAGRATAAMMEKVSTVAVRVPAAGAAAGFPWGPATVAGVLLSAGLAGWAGARSPADSRPSAAWTGPAPDPMTAVAAGGKAWDTRLAEVLERLERTGREGLPALRSLRLAAVLNDLPAEELAALGPYALSRSGDEAVRTAVAARWAVTGFHAAWKAAGPASGSGPGPGMGAAVFAEGLRALAERSPQDASGFFQILSPPDRRQLAAALLAGLGASDPALGRRTALELAVSTSPPDLGNLLLPFYTAWARRDPRAAAVSSSQGDPALNRRGRADGVAFAGVMRQWASQDPAAAAAFLAALPPGENRSRAYAGVLDHLAGAFPESIGAWLAAMPGAELPAPGTKAAALTSPAFLQLAAASEAWSHRCPADARALAATADHAVLRRALWCGIAGALASTDPQEASRLADAQPESALANAMRGIIAQKSTPPAP